MIPILSIFIFIFISLPTSILLPASGFCGEIFFWTDNNGIQHYTNVPPASSIEGVQTYMEQSDTEQSDTEQSNTEQSNTEQYITNTSDNSQNTSDNSHKIQEDNVALNSFLSDQKHQLTFKVIKIYDGDSIKVEGAELTLMIRLVGIDAPESGGSKGKKWKIRENNSSFKKHSSYVQGEHKGQPFSQEAKEALSRMVDGKNIHIKNYGTDRYNRMLAEIFTADGTLVNLELVKQGMAEVYRGKPPEGLDSTTYQRAESEAKRRYQGIWSLGSSYESPKEWRKQNPRK